MKILIIFTFLKEKQMNETKDGNVQCASMKFTYIYYHIKLSKIINHIFISVFPEGDARQV